MLISDEHKLYTRLKNMSDSDENEFKEFLVDLEAHNDFVDMHESAVGSIKYLLDNSISSLSDKQLQVVSKGLIEHNYLHECEWCGEKIDWNEMLLAVEDNKCSTCKDKLNKAGVDI